MVEQEPEEPLVDVTEEGQTFGGFLWSSMLKRARTQRAELLLLSAEFV